MREGRENAASVSELIEQRQLSEGREREWERMRRMQSEGHSQKKCARTCCLIADWLIIGWWVRDEMCYTMWCDSHKWRNEEEKREWWECWECMDFFVVVVVGCINRLNWRDLLSRLCKIDGNSFDVLVQMCTHTHTQTDRETRGYLACKLPSPLVERWNERKGERERGTQQ